MTEDEKIKLEKLANELAHNEEIDKLLRQRMENTLVFDWKTGKISSLNDYQKY
jgi:hypothetical protein